MDSEQPHGLATVATVRIFLSYAPRTKDETDLSDCLVDLFASAFDLPPKAVFAYTAAGHGVPSGIDLFDGLKSALASSQVVLAIATPAVASSSYSQFEAAASDLAGKYSVPLLPDPSFHSHVPAVFQKVAARNLASIGELCQLVDDMRAPLGVNGTQPAFLWITKAERVIEAARAVAGKASHEAEVEQLQSRIRTAESLQARLRWAAGLCALAALTLTIALTMLWQAHSSLNSVNADLTTELSKSRSEVARINRRSVYLPTMRIDGQVLSGSGTTVEGALVVACAALKYPSSMLSNLDACPEALGLPAETDSEGKFSIDLRSLPDLPDNLAPVAPLHDFWLTAQHSSEGSVRLRVQPVNAQNLLLRH